MARGRMIARSLSTSQKFAALQDATVLSEFAQVLYMLLIVHSDDYGRGPGDTFTVKHLIVPTTCRPLSDVDIALAAMNTVGLIHWYAVGGRKFIQIQDFDTHQCGLHKRTQSKFPEAPGGSGEIPSPLF